jgi:hypothetical protein
MNFLNSPSFCGVLDLSGISLSQLSLAIVYSLML